MEHNGTYTECTWCDAYEYAVTELGYSPEDAAGYANEEEEYTAR